MIGLVSKNEFQDAAIQSSKKIAMSILKIFFPIAGSILASQLPAFIDMMFISRISITGVAAFGLGAQTLIVMYLFTSGSNTRLQIIAAQKGKEIAGAYHLKYTYLVVLPVTLLVLGILLYIAHSSPDEEIKSILMIIAPSLTLIYCVSMFNLNLSGILIGLQKNKIMFYTSLLSTTIHAIGVFTFFNMGISIIYKITLISSIPVLAEGISIIIRMKSIMPLGKHEEISDFKEFIKRSTTRNLASGCAVSASSVKGTGLLTII